MSLTLHEIQRYAHQLKLEHIGLKGQCQLKKSRVLCIGAGGLGSSLLYYLTAAGIGTIGIVDDDTIELSNLQRQILYQNDHLHYLKATIAKQQLMKLDPTIHIEAYPERLTSHNAANLLGQYDIIADCSDNFATRYLINDVAFSLKKPFVFAGAFKFQGQCTTFLGTRPPCFRCLFPVSPEDNVFAPCSEQGVLGIVAGTLGLLQATEIIKILLNIGEILFKQLLVIDLFNMNFTKIHYTKNKQCEYCTK